jgi:3-oxoacyl-[acyl-carrier protein] reductase
MDLNLKDKKVLITGASTGIGAAIAEKFLDEGAIVIIVSRGSDKLYTTEKRLKTNFDKSRIYAKCCDCTDYNSVSLLRVEVKNTFGELDIVVANVGDGQSLPDPIPDEKQWKKTWSTNFESALITSRAFLPMLEKSKGSLLFISSIAGIEASGAPVDYSTAKTAVIALAKNMARKLASKVRVNVIAPGNIFFKNGVWDKKTQDNPENVKKIISSTVPMNRFGTTQEIADAAVFLCSSKSSFTTGSVLVIDGGQTMNVI